MKPTSSYDIAAVEELGTRFHAIILNLDETEGTITMEGNTFQDNRFRFADCSGTRQSSSIDGKYSVASTYYDYSMMAEKSLVTLLDLIFL